MFESVLVQSSNIEKLNGKSTVSFTVIAQYVEPAFDAHNTDVTASVPNIKTSQSVTESPKLFTSGGSQ
jgi:hypothetical protein